MAEETPIPASPIQSSFTGTEWLRLLELAKGNSLKDLPLHFYTLSAQLPLAQLNRKEQMFIIWSVMDEIAIMKRSGARSVEDLIKYNEFLCGAVGQTSRAVGGAERAQLSTARTIIETIEGSKKPSVLSFLSKGEKG